MVDPTPHAPPKSEPELSGKRLGDYHLIRRLGRGGMADVYLAEQGSLHRHVAFKVLRSGFSGDEKYVKRFHNEAQAAAALVHANIVQIYEVGCIDRVHFIAQEYVAGRNLRQLLTRKGPLDVRLAVSIMRQVAAALHKAGQRGIIHRDIKPENIMLASTGEVKVADFGLARVTNATGKVDLTQVGVTMGTPLYMSPEQVEGGSVDPRSDLYSFGVTCYQMIAGRPPFEGDTPLSVAIQHLNNEPRPLQEFRPDLPEGLSRIVHKMLAKKLADRYQAASDLLRDLRALHVEGLEEGWPSDIDEWDTAELLALADARAAATQKLQTVMRTDTAPRSLGSRALWLVLALVPLALLAGGMAAWFHRPESLLRVSADDLPVVERQGTAAGQFGLAQQQWDERAFQSVLEYFPPEESRDNELYGYRAKLQLAYIYEESNRITEAINLYSELASQDLDPQLKAFGLSGQANLYSRQGKRSSAAERLHSLVQLLVVSQDRIPQRERGSWMRRWRDQLDAPLRGEFDLELRGANEASNAGGRTLDAS